MLYKFSCKYNTFDAIYANISDVYAWGYGLVSTTFSYITKMVYSDCMF